MREIEEMYSALSVAASVYFDIVICVEDNLLID